MTGYLPRAVARELRGGKALLLLSVAGVALGVGSVLSVQILSGSALGAFSGTVRAVSGESDLAVLGWAGGLDEGLLPEVLATPGVAAAGPVWRGEAAVEGRPGAWLEIVGVDLLAPARAPAAAGAGRDPGALAAALGTRGWVGLTAAQAAALGVRDGDRLPVTLGSRRVTLVVGATLDLSRVAPLASRELAIMDIAQAQGLLGTRGRIQEIDVTAAPGLARPELARRLEARLGGRGRVVTPEQREIEAEGLLAAFRLNLTALSLVSLLVGGFLVYASVRASLARRREELGVLRALGATRAQVLLLVLGEAAALGAVGTAAGIPLGWLAARANLTAVSATIRNLYLLEGMERVAVGPGLLALAVLTGVGGAAAGALLPALDASRADPRALLASLTLEEREGAGAGRLLGIGLAALALAALAARALAGRWAGAGFILGLGVLAAVPLASPAALRAQGRTGRARRLGVRHGARTAGTRLAPAAGALAVAVAMLAGVTVMVASFRSTVERWLDATLRADVYVTTPSWRRGRSEATLAPEVVARLLAYPGARAVDLLRQHLGYAGDRRVLVAGLDAALPGGEGRVALLGGDGAVAMEALRRGAVLVSEPLARKAGIGVGSSLALRGPEGEQRFPVAGVYRDYGNEGGAVLMDLGAYGRAFGPGAPTNAALFLRPGVEPERAIADLRAGLGGAALRIRSNRTLRAEVLAVFEQTFAVTRLLEGAGLLIAAAGVTLSLLVLGRERRGELALYRALGATRGQLFRVFLGRGLGLAATGLALGGLGGAALALVLVEAVNPAYFGWSLGLSWPWRALAGEAVAILAAAAAASLFPALAASRTPAQELSRDAL